MRLPVVVVYKRPKGRKYFIQVFPTLYVDDIFNLNKLKPPIPHEDQLIEVGYGESLIEIYKEQYNATIVKNDETSNSSS